VVLAPSTSSSALSGLADRLAPFACHVVSARHPAVGQLRLRVDRSSRWGNPFQPRDRSALERLRVVAAYARFLRGMDPVRRAGLLPPIWQHLQAGGALECWCAPELCHGQVLAAFALDLGRQYQSSWQP
jgi:hypothetical protein